MRTRRTIIAAATGAALVAGLAAPATAGTATGSTEIGTVQVTASNAQWVEYGGCLEVPTSASATLPHSDVSWRVYLDAYWPGSGSSASSDFMAGAGWGNLSDSGDFLMCPSTDRAGRYTVVGTVEFRDIRRNQRASTPVSTSFTLSKMTSTATITKVRKLRGGTKVVGRATAASAKLGTIGARGDVIVKAKKPRTKRWARVGVDDPNDRGRFVVRTGGKYPKGTKFKAIYRGDQITQRDVSPVRR